MGRFYVKYNIARSHCKDITLADMELNDGRQLDKYSCQPMDPFL